MMCVWYWGLEPVVVARRNHAAKFVLDGVGRAVKHHADDRLGPPDLAPEAGHAVGDWGVCIAGPERDHENLLAWPGAFVNVDPCGHAPGICQDSPVTQPHI